MKKYYLHLSFAAFTAVLLMVGAPRAQGQGGYCTPFFDLTGGSIDIFTFHTLVNMYSGHEQWGYIEYPSTQHTTHVGIGKTYPIGVSKTSSNSDTLIVWIDYDDSQTFEDSEIIFTDSLPWWESSATGFVTIPNDTALIGPKRLRVVTFTSYLPYNECDTSWRGEAEDYTIYINDTSASGDKFCPCYSENSVSTGFKIDEFSVFQLVNNGSGQTDHYTYFPPSQFTTNLVLGNPYITTISKNGVGTTGGYGLWIDYDDDGVFSANEKLLSAGPDIRMVSKLIHIPSDTTYLGTHRMRVRSSWGEVPDNPCGSVEVGETEDYDVTFVTSLSEEEINEPKWSIFPNPTNGNLHVRGTTSSTYQILSVNGQVVQRGAISEKISIATLPAGVYLFETGEQRQRFIKL